LAVGSEALIRGEELRWCCCNNRKLWKNDTIP
jgi:hypothetical protein